MYLDFFFNQNFNLLENSTKRISETLCFDTVLVVMIHRLRGCVIITHRDPAKPAARFSMTVGEAGLHMMMTS